MKQLLLRKNWLVSLAAIVVCLVPLPALADSDLLDAEAPSSTPPSPPIQDYHLYILARTVRTATRLPGESNFDLSQRVLTAARNGASALMESGTRRQKSQIEALPNVISVTYNSFSPDASSPSEDVSIVGDDATATVQVWGTNNFTAYVGS